jgi:hypothetical protein
MNTLLCSKNSFHTFCERQGWLLLFDKVNDEKSEIGYLLPSGAAIFTVFDTEGNFDHMSDTTTSTISVDSEENSDE